MGVASQLLSSALQGDPKVWLGVLASILFFTHFVPWFSDPRRIRSQGIQGPFLAQFTTLWLALQAGLGHRWKIVHEVHKKYGTFARLAPNHVSIASEVAVPHVYGHGTGTLKSDFYDAFVSIRRGLFNTRDRAEHARKRKIVSHVFSLKSVRAFEPYIRDEIRKLCKRWDEFTDAAAKGETGMLANKVKAENGQAWFDVLLWLNFLAFDIIGDLAFGAPFGMLERGEDAAAVEHEIPPSSKPSESGEPEKPKSEIKYVPAIRILNQRGEFSATMGCMPSWSRPYVKHLPWFRQGLASVKALAGIAIAAVNARIASGSTRDDLLGRLQQGRDENGEPMGREELTAEALTQLIAGSDTTSNSSCAIVYYIVSNPSVVRKLQEELDGALGSVEGVPNYEDVKDLPYLDACINEALRVHSTSSIGLPRVAPEEGISVLGKSFPAGTVLSCPTYTVHRLKHIWGEDSEIYRPERWLEDPEKAKKFQEAFLPFSFGPRACVGRNVAFMELLLIISTLFYRYEFTLARPGVELPTREGFLRKPLLLDVGIKRR